MEHPFHVKGKGWVQAFDLEPGDLVTQKDGSLATVYGLWYIYSENPVTVYNFEVADFHTYFVGDNSLLVHNMCDGGLIKGRPKLAKGAVKIRSDSRKVNSQEFIDFIRNSGKSFRSSEWKYRMETWRLPNGKYIERHYWYNKITGESFYHK